MSTDKDSIRKLQLENLNDRYHPPYSHESMLSSPMESPVASIMPIGFDDGVGEILLCLMVGGPQRD